MQIDVDLRGLIRWLDVGENKTTQNNDVSPAAIETIAIPLLIKRRGNEARIVVEGRDLTRADPGLVEVIGRAQYYLSLLTDGAGRSLADLAKATGVHIADVSRVLPLAFLARPLVDAILTGRHPVELTARQLARLGNLPVDWQQHGHCSASSRINLSILHRREKLLDTQNTQLRRRPDSASSRPKSGLLCPKLRSLSALSCGNVAAIRRALPRPRF